jgi:hypothetical protein
MYLPVSTQPDCASAWREAVRAVDGQRQDSAYNVIIDIINPTHNASLANPKVAIVDRFLTEVAKTKSVETVANTIFPAGLYRRYGAPTFFDVFEKRVLPKVRKSERWSGYYFERMTHYPGTPANQLWYIVERIRDGNVRALNKFELSLFDAQRDIDLSPYGGQCLSFLSFKLVPRAPKTLNLTAMYRNHFYIEKLLGNLIGLGRLMAFVANESSVNVGSLTVISTHAIIDKPRKTHKTDLDAMLTLFDQTDEAPVAA